MPGPTEPTTEQMNNALQPVVKELRQLKQGLFEVDLFRCIQLLILLTTQGVEMKIHSQEPAKVYADCICANCDTPAAHKFNGTAGHSHDFHPCPYCDATVVDVDTMSGYDGSKTIFSITTAIMD
jgi:hypothetical protein